MAKKKDTQTELNSALVKATAEANQIFGKIGKVVEKEIKGGVARRKRLGGMLKYYHREVA